MITRFAFVLLLASGNIAKAEPQLSVGFGEVDVSPVIGPKPVFMAGFGQDRRATKIHDPIMARAVVMSDGTKKIAMVCVDVVGLFLPSVENVRKQLTGYETVLVSSTHNHEGPDTLGLWGSNPFRSGVDADYLKSLENGIVAAIQKADKSMQNATVEIGTARDASLLHDARLPDIKHDEIVVLRFRNSKEAKLLGLLVQWNCHPETLDSRNTEISADYVHRTVESLRKTHGCPVAYFTGTVGGLMSSLHVEVKNDKGVSLKDGTFEKTDAYGELVAGLANKALAKAVAINLVPFDIRTQPVLLPIENGLYRIAWQVGKLRRSIYKWDGDSMPAKLNETKDIAQPVAVLSEIGYLKLGDLEIAAIPGEIYPELVLGKVQDPVDAGADYPDAAIEPAIYPQLRGKHKMLIGLANDELGYFIPKRQWDEKAPYCYGLKKSQYGEINSIGPEAAPLLCEAFRKLVAGK